MNELPQLRSARKDAYLPPRNDLVEMLPTSFQTLLDVGCAGGATAAATLHRYPGVTITGIELDRALAEEAATIVQRVLEGDAVEVLSRLCARGETFDVVVCGDILEHLVDPWLALRLVRRLCPEGTVLVSLPNVAHLNTLVALVFRRRWPYEEYGIHDRTHLRFFGRGNLEELFEQAGFRLQALRCRYRFLDRPHWLNRKGEPIVARLPVLRRLWEYQYLCRLA